MIFIRFKGWLSIKNILLCCETEHCALSLDDFIWVLQYTARVLPLTAAMFFLFQEEELRESQAKRQKQQDQIDELMKKVATSDTASNTLSGELQGVKSQFAGTVAINGLFTNKVHFIAMIASKSHSLS